MTPDAPLASGTELYLPNDSPTSEREFFKWKKQIKIGNKYNRLLLFRCDILHKSSTYFGTDKNNGRLIQLFFIKTSLDT